ncbi:hypothetical protein AB0P15_10295 [Streptomyces sp. NPDC087917]|uniref:hypothetical protein n=1 Tax=Streptomyces sp. NPDC087917 TaxID=3155060 RepID=UPI00341D4126
MIGTQWTTGRSGPAVALVAALALASLASLTGCGAGGGAGHGPGRGPRPDAGHAARLAAAPAVEPTTAQARTLARAEQILISRCMVGRGFAYAVTGTAPESEERRVFPYAVDDVEWARAHGYGGRADRADAEARLADPNQRYFRGLSPARRAAARTALMGASPVGLSATTPTGMTLTASAEGCTAGAQRELYGDLPGWFRVKVITMNLRPVRESLVHEDPKYARAVGAWAACMREAGRPYASPDASRQAAATLTEGLPADRAEATETALAVTEATCATGTELARVSRALDRAHGEEVRSRFRDEIALRQRFQNAALPTAERVVRQYPDEDGPSGRSGAPSDTSGENHG